jgi:hypothetical protein
MTLLIDFTLPRFHPNPDPYLSDFLFLSSIWEGGSNELTMVRMFVFNPKIPYSPVLV